MDYFALVEEVVRQLLEDEPKSNKQKAAEYWAGRKERDARRKEMWPGNSKDQRLKDIKSHFAPGGAHEKGECGPVCTYGDF